MTEIDAILIHPDGNVTRHTVISGDLISIRGTLNVKHIELVGLPNGQSMYIDEEGKMNGQPANMVATEESGLQPYDIIMGPALILGPPDDEGYDLSIDPAYAILLLDYNHRRP